MPLFCWKIWERSGLGLVHCVHRGEFAMPLLLLEGLGEIWSGRHNATLVLRQHIFSSISDPFGMGHSGFRITAPDGSPKWVTYGSLFGHHKWFQTSGLIHGVHRGEFAMPLFERSGRDLVLVLYTVSTGANLPCHFLTSLGEAARAHYNP